MTEATSASAPDPSEPTGERRPGRVWVSRIVVAVAVLATVVLVARDPEQLRVLGEARPDQIAANAGLQVLLLFATAATHHFVIQEVSGVTIPRSTWARLFVVARFLNNVVPQVGNAYRAARLRTDWGVSLTAYLSAYVAFMWLLTSFNFLLATVVVVVTGQTFDIAGVPAPLLLGTGLVGLVTGPLLVNLLFERLPALEGRLGWLHRRLQVFLDGSINAFTRPSVLARGLLLAMVAAALATAVTWTGFRALGNTLTLPQVLVFYVIIQLSSFVQVTPGNIGLQEVAFGLLANEFGIPIAAGVLASALIRLIGLAALAVVAVPLGGIGVLRHWRGRSDETQDAGTRDDDLPQAPAGRTS